MQLNKDTMASYNNFKKSVLGHLEQFLPKEGKPGFFNGKGHYPHIVEVPGKSQMEVIERILLSDGIEDVAEFRKPQRYAHHLNSSQVVCYEFFRPLLSSQEGKLVIKDEEMQRVLNVMGIPFAPFVGATAEFEKEFDDREGTNFDFYMESPDGESHIYVEVKYTEQGFGTCENNKSHRNKFKNTYLDLIENSVCLNETAKRMRTTSDFPIMRKHYQLFRNSLRVRNENDYVVFLYPKANTIAEYQFKHFKEEFISKEMTAHVLGVHWEDLTASMSQRFREKFFGFDTV